MALSITLRSKRNDFFSTAPVEQKFKNQLFYLIHANYVPEIHRYSWSRSKAAFPLFPRPRNVKREANCRLITIAMMFLTAERLQLPSSRPK